MATENASVIPDNYPTKFQHEALKLVGELVKVTSSAFYLIDASMRHRDIVRFNLDPEVGKQYIKTFRPLDPLNPRQFDHTDDRVVTIDSLMPYQQLRQTIYYQDFMKPSNHRYVADMFFRCQGEVIAVVSLLRQEALGPYTKQELTLLRKLQPFLEFSLNSVYQPSRVAQRQSLQQRYQLTPRELDVLERAVAGSTNKEIASDLALGLATVKTHLLHVFRKTGVSSRAELIAKAVAEFPEG